MILHNPILPGFNPDPSILRVGEDYYIATSTFEWFPGVQIHHSRDLVNWKLIGRPLSRTSQLDMLGVPDSCGVWAPCLTYDSGTYYLVYCNVKSFDGTWKDTPNFLVTAESIEGPWSDPIYLDSRGFDSSLFHDENGRKWYISMIVDHRGGQLFGGIILQEYDPKSQRLVGPSHMIFEGTSLGNTEGPHLYQKDGYYYLLMAEGGTEYGHAMSIARSKEITGPYELHPENPLVTCRNHPEHGLQKSGHGDFVQTPEGDWYAVFLVGRPLSTLGRCTLGRETAIEQLVWPAGEWPRLAHGEGNLPRTSFDIPGEVEIDASLHGSHQENFNQAQLNIHFQSLRVPIDESWCSLTERPGYLRIKGRESLSSFHEQSMIARRIQHFHVEVSVVLEFQPQSFQRMAGLVFYYNTAHFHYLHITLDREGDRSLYLITSDNFAYTDHPEGRVKLPAEGPVRLKGVFNRVSLQFYYALELDQWIKVGPELDGSILSDDYVRDGSNRYRPAFTGSFVGMCCQDLAGHGHHVDFERFRYEVIS